MSLTITVEVGHHVVLSVDTAKCPISDNEARILLVRTLEMHRHQEPDLTFTLQYTDFVRSRTYEVPFSHERIPWRSEKTP